MNPTRRWADQQVEALWNRAQVAGISRRKFLVLLAGGGATAVLAACAPAVTTTPTPAPTPKPSLSPTPTPTPTPKPSPTPSPSPSPSPSPTPAPPPPRLIYKPIPEQYFVPLGSNTETRLEFMANRTYQMPNGMFFVRSHTYYEFVECQDLETKHRR